MENKEDKYLVWLEGDIDEISGIAPYATIYISDRQRSSYHGDITEFIAWSFLSNYSGNRCEGLESVSVIVEDAWGVRVRRICAFQNKVEQNND